MINSVTTNYILLGLKQLIFKDKIGIARGRDIEKKMFIFFFGWSALFFFLYPALGWMRSCGLENII